MQQTDKTGDKNKLSLQNTNNKTKKKTIKNKKQIVFLSNHFT